MTKLGARHDAMSNLIGCSVRIADIRIIAKFVGYNNNQYKLCVQKQP